MSYFLLLIISSNLKPQTFRILIFHSSCKKSLVNSNNDSENSVKTTKTDKYLLRLLIAPFKFLQLGKSRMCFFPQNAGKILLNIYDSIYARFKEENSHSSR